VVRPGLEFKKDVGNLYNPRTRFSYRGNPRFRNDVKRKKFGRYVEGKGFARAGSKFFTRK